MTRRFTIALMAFALLAVACGQYPCVHDRAVASGEIPGTGTALGGPAAGTTGPGGTTVGGPGGTTTGGPGTTPGGGTTTTTGGPGTTGGGTDSDGDGNPDGGGPSVPTGGDATGVTATTITIGIHAPLTGAAPLKQTSFEKGKDLYWENGNNGKPVTIFGRKVEVVFRDDQYNPSHARLVCQEMAEQEHAFLLIGGGGTDQIQACAQYAYSAGIPYLSAGVTEIGLRGLGNYFALSKSYPQQVPLLADYIRKKFRPAGNSVAMVATNTANFDDAVQVFQQEFPQGAVFRPEKNDRGASMAGNLCTGPSKRYDVVFPLTSPSYYLEMAGASKCNPQYAGVGITMGLDQVANLGCQTGGSTRNAVFFSPAPAFADSNKYEPLFRKSGGSDDIMFLFWGLSKVLHQLFQKTGENLTREAFIASTSNATVKTGTYPDLRYTPQDHFGAQQVHVLKNVCQGNGGYYVTDQAFASGF
jgi:branched-chain amino acid transport system substrate-binding protein